MSLQLPPLRILYLEDNPLIVFHVEAMIEDLGYVFAGSAGSFAELVAGFDAFEMDAALVDIDLADGRTGPAAAAWLQERGIPSIFVTGQMGVAAEYPALSLGAIAKPISAQELAEKLEWFLRKDLGSQRE
jgi:DNA-binding response OmpR family regulator